MQTSSPYPMIAVEEALDRILARARALGPVLVDFQLAQGMVLARDVVAPDDFPARARSAVDGYAVTAQPGPLRLQVVGEVTAGQPGEYSVDERSAVRVMTGGVLPPGAEAVVMVEDTEERDGVVTISTSPPRGANVQGAGHDLKRGQLVLRSGSRVGPAEVGLLASIGQIQVLVHPRPRVAVLATGDELVEPAETPTDGFLRDSNRFALIAAAREAGADVVWHGHGRDERGALETLVRAALDQADVLVTSGGVSMGTRDLMKPLLAEVGELQFGRIAFKPGKPLTFATIGSKLAFGLPGYPVSSLVTFEVFVRPALLKLQGATPLHRPRVTAHLEHDLRPDRSRLEYHRAMLRWDDDRLLARSTGSQSSSRLLSMVGANALLEIPEGDRTLPAGSRVTALVTGELAVEA